MGYLIISTSASSSSHGAVKSEVILRSSSATRLEVYPAPPLPGKRSASPTLYAGPAHCRQVWTALYLIPLFDKHRQEMNVVLQ